MNLCETPGWYLLILQQMILYNGCVQFILRPMILKSDAANTKYIKQCAEACGSICRTYKKQHQSAAVGFSMTALDSLFLAGTLNVYQI